MGLMALTVTSGTTFRAMRALFACAMVMELMALSLQAAPPAEIDYQGKVMTGTTAFAGSGHFKFAFSDADAMTNYWSNDGTSRGEPHACVTNTVVAGRFSVTLGAVPMAPIDPLIFSMADDLYLRVWFAGKTSVFQELLPAQKLVSTPFAINALTLDGHPLAFFSDAAHLTDGTLDVARLPGTVTRLGSSIEAVEVTGSTFSNTFWLVNGNSGTPGYLGTRDASPLEFRVHETLAIFIQADGRVGIGTDHPSTDFDVAGEGRFEQGISFVAPLGDLSMGVYTNRP